MDDAQVPLTQQLASLLQAHGVAALVQDDRVHLPDVERSANLWMERTSPNGFLMEVRATLDGDTVLADRWGALGKTAEEASQDGMRSFSGQAFHVLMAAVWGVLDLDQVDHEVRQVGTSAWDVYLSGATTRVSHGIPPLTMPDGLVDAVLDAVDARCTAGSAHWARVYVASVGGTITYEGLVDDEPDDRLEGALQAASWSFPDEGFASLRWFLLARQRDGDAPAHRGGRAKRVGAGERVNRR